MKDPLDFRGTRASSIIVHQVPPERADAFLEWERGIVSTAATFAGYEATDVYPPADPRDREWVIMIHFSGADALKAWIDSPERAACTQKLPEGISRIRVTTLPSGFGNWFAGMITGKTSAPPAWKMALTVLLALFPTVMLLGIYLSPHTAAYGFAPSVLVGNAVSVAILQWLIMPWLTRYLTPWLNAPARSRLTVVGAGMIVVVLGVMLLIFEVAVGPVKPGS